MVVVASNGRQGLQQFCREPADLVLLDIFMPELDGLETLVELHRDYPAAKVIAISGGGKECDSSYLECARMLGAHSVLPNPLNREQLLLIVGSCYEGFHRIPIVASVIVRANKSLTLMVVDELHGRHIPNGAVRPRQGGLWREHPGLDFRLPLSEGLEARSAALSPDHSAKSRPFPVQLQEHRMRVS